MKKYYCSRYAIFSIALIFNFVCIDFLYGQNYRCFDAGRGDDFEEYMAFKALNCIVYSCVSDFEKTDFLSKPILNDSIVKEIAFFSKFYKDSLHSHYRTYLGFLKLDDIPNHVFTRNIFSIEKDKIIIQLEVKFKYIGGFLKIEKISIYHNGKIKHHSEFDKYLYSTTIDGRTNKLIPPPPFPVSRPWDNYSFKDIASYPNLCPCENDKIFIASYDKYFLNDKYKYQFLKSISWDRYIAKNENLYGVIDVENEIVVLFQFQDMKSINGTLLKVKKENKYGVIESNGKTILPIIYDEIYPNTTYGRPLKHYVRFSRLEKNGMKGIYNHYEKILIPCEYESIVPLLSGEYFKAKKDSKYAMLDKNGDALTPFIYEKIEVQQETYFSFEQEKKSFNWMPKIKRKKYRKSLK